MKRKSIPRCEGCKYALAKSGNDFLCDLLRTQQNEPAWVVTLKENGFERYENCAFRRWHASLSTEELSTEELVALAKRARVGEVEPTDYRWVRRVA